jgi:hypothetical protein
MPSLICGKATLFMVLDALCVCVQGEQGLSSTAQQQLAQQQQ